MNVIRQEKSGTIELRLEPNEYLIVHTPKGTIDIDVEHAHLDIGETAAANFNITRWSPFSRGAESIDLVDLTQKDSEAAKALKEAGRLGIDWTHRALDSKVLTVARHEHGEWAAWVGAVPGKNHAKEAGAVLARGAKLPREMAELIYPDFKQYRWRP